MKALTICFALLCAIPAMVSQAHARDELTLVVNRSEDTATYYISMPSDGIEPILGSDPAMLFSEDGHVPIDTFRQTGSFDLADQMFANVTGGFNGKRFAFESMSMMVHPKSQPLPFAAPWDAYTAISVCSVDYAQDQLVPGVLQLYHGGFTDQVTEHGPLTLNFPQTGRDALQIVVHHYESGRLLGTSVETLQDGGSITIAAGPAAGLDRLMKSSLIWVLLIAGSLALIGVVRSRGKGPRQPLSNG